MAEKANVRVASIEVELGMSVQNKSGIWCKPTARMVLTVDGGTSPAQRAAIIKQGFDGLLKDWKYHNQGLRILRGRCFLSYQ